MSNHRTLGQAILIGIWYTVLYSFSAAVWATTGNIDNKPVIFSKETAYVCLQDHAKFLSVHQGHITPALALARTDQFRSWSDFTYSKNDPEIWVYFTLKNETEKTLHFYLNGQYTDYIDLYTVQKGIPQLMQSSGYLTPLNERPISNWGMLLSHSLEKGSSQSYLFRLKSITRNSRQLIDYALLPCAKVFSEQSYNNDYKRSTTHTYFFMGALFIMFLYNLCISVFTLYKEYLLFSFYNLCLLLAYGFVSDFFLESGMIPIHDTFRNIQYLIFSLKFLLFFHFAVRYLDVRQHFPAIARILKIIIWSFAVVVPTCIFFSFYATSFTLITAVSSLCYALILWINLKLFKRSKSARFMLPGLLLIIAVDGLNAMSQFNWITTTVLINTTTVLYMFGIICFSFAVAYKLRISKKFLYRMRHEHQLQQERLKAEENLRLELENENQQKATSLSNTSVQLLDFSKKVTDVIKEIQSAETPDKKVIKQLEELRQFDDQWEIMKVHFESIHPDFFLNLEQNFPELSPNEHKLLAFIKMNMANKEIAILLNVTRGAVEQAKRRLKRKLGMENDENDILKHINEKEIPL